MLSPIFASICATPRRPPPVIDSHAALTAYVGKTGTRFLDLGASNGNSRKTLERLVHNVDPASSSQQQVLGLDVSDEKLRTCNIDGVHCVKADLRDIFPSTGAAAPVVGGCRLAASCRTTC